MMELDKSLFHDSPIWNQKVDGYFQQTPIFLRQEQLPEHKKKLHIQAGYELNISHEGKAAFVVGNKIYMQSSRQVILFPGSVPHQVFPDGATLYKRSVICFNEELNAMAKDDDFLLPLESDLLYKDSCLQLQLQADSYTKITGLLQRMDDELKYGKPGWKRMMLSHMLEMTVLLQRSMETARADQPNKHSVKSSADCVMLCCDYIDKHLNEELSLQRISKLFYVSPEHLTRSFRKDKGVSFYQYVLLQRVHASKVMLQKRPDLSVTEIAYSLGFTSSTQFGRTFKSVMKMTPSDFRLHTAVSIY